MTVWIVNPFDNLPAEGTRPQRYWLMARAFCRTGCKVVYWTSDFSHAYKSKRVYSRVCNDGFEVRVVESTPYQRNVCLKRVISHRKLASDWYRLADKEFLSPDLVIASMPPLGLCDAARKFAKKRGAMFIADVQDAWPETFERVFPRFVFSLLGIRSLAKRIYCEADAVSAVAKRYIELAQKYGSDAPSAVFVHCIDMAGSPRSVPRNSGPLRLVYAGNMSMSYDLETVINAVAELDGVSLDIAGNGPDMGRLQKLVSKLHLIGNKVTIHGYLEEDALSRLLCSCDVGVVPMFPNSCVGIPGKIADYAAARLRIIESLGGELGALVDGYAVGVHYDAGNVESFKCAIKSVQDCPPDCRLDGFAKQFDAQCVMNAYLKWVEGLVRCRQDWGNTRGPHHDPLLCNRMIGF